MESGYSYNAFTGPTLNFVGIWNQTTILQVPFHSLNLNINKDIWEADERIQAGFGIQNMLNW